MLSTVQCLFNALDFCLVTFLIKFPVPHSLPASSVFSSQTRPCPSSAPFQLTSKNLKSGLIALLLLCSITNLLTNCVDFTLISRVSVLISSTVITLLQATSFLPALNHCSGTITSLLLLSLPFIPYAAIAVTFTNCKSGVNVMAQGV